jgi:hypothetical protein
MGSLIEDCATQSVGDRCILERFVLEHNTRHCMRRKEKKDRIAGGQVPLYT